MVTDMSANKRRKFNGQILHYTRKVQYNVNDRLIY